MGCQPGVPRVFGPIEGRFEPHIRHPLRPRKHASAKSKKQQWFVSIQTLAHVNPGIPDPKHIAKKRKKECRLSGLNTRPSDDWIPEVSLQSDALPAELNRLLIGRRVRD